MPPPVRPLPAGVAAVGRGRRFEAAPTVGTASEIVTHDCSPPSAIFRNRLPKLARCASPRKINTCRLPVIPPPDKPTGHRRPPQRAAAQLRAYFPEDASSTVPALLPLIAGQDAIVASAAAVAAGICARGTDGPAAAAAITAGWERAGDRAERWAIAIALAQLLNHAGSAATSQHPCRTASDCFDRTRQWAQWQEYGAELRTQRRDHKRSMLMGSPRFAGESLVVRLTCVLTRSRSAPSTPTGRTHNPNLP
jgi:hypothetical protein